MGFKTWGSETLTASDMNNYLMKQANIRTTVGSEPTGEAGMKVMLTDKEQERVWSGSAWIRGGWWSANGRTGCQLRRTSAPQAISNQVSTAIAWNDDTLDVDGFYTPSGGTITIPTGCGGLYAAQVAVTFANPVSAYLQIGLGGKINFVKNGSALYEHCIRDSATDDSASFFPIPLAAGDTVSINVVQTSGSSNNLTARLEFWRMGA